MFSSLVVGVPEISYDVKYALMPAVSPGGCLHRYPRLLHCFAVDIDLCLRSLGQKLPDNERAEGHYPLPDWTHS